MRFARSLVRRVLPRRVLSGLLWQLTFATAVVPSHHLRLWIYRTLGMQIGRRARVHRGLEIRAAKHVAIGARTIVGFDCILDGRGGIELGDDVNLSSEVAIWTMQHDHRSADFGAVVGRVQVGDRAWLSFRTTILPGVTIGEGAVVAAGSIVTKDVLPYAIVAGVPAVQVGERTRDLAYRLDGRTAPHFI
jgi:acetyltransferase-like isoleucine patch superfamily enzyme